MVQFIEAEVPKTEETKPYEENGYQFDEVKDPKVLETYDLTNNVHQNMMLGEETQPEKTAKIYDLSKRTGFPVPLVKAQEKSAENQVRKAKIDKLTGVHPLALQYLADPQSYEVSKNDLDEMTAVAQAVTDSVIGTYEKVKTSFTVGQQTVDGGKLYTDKVFSVLTGTDNPDLDKRIAAFRSSEVKSPVDDGVIETGLTAAAEMTPLLWDTALAAGIAGFPTAVAFGGGASLMGPAAPAAVPAAFFTGLVVGGKGGAAYNIFQIETGNAYRELSEMKDEDGVPMDPKIAAVASIGIGAINAGLEYVGMEALASLFLGGRKVLSALTRSAVKETLKKKAVRDSLLAIAGRYGTAVGTEAIQEMVQEVVNILGANISGYVSNEEEGTRFKGITFEEAIPRILENGKEAFAASATLGIPGIGISVISHTQKAQNTQAFHDRISSISEKVNKSQTKNLSPDHMQMYLEKIGLTEDAYIGFEAAQVLFQSDPEGASALFEKLGVTGEDVSKASDIGQDIKVTASSLVSQLSEDELNQVLPDVKPAPSVFSKRELDKINIMDEMDRTLDLYRDAVGDQVVFNDELKRVREGFISQGESVEIVDNNMRLLEDFANRMALEGRDRVDMVRSIISNFQQENPLPESIEYDQNGNLMVNSGKFKDFISGTKVLDEKGLPATVYSGHGNVSLFGDKFDPKKATAGGFYGTFDPEIASSYALGKFGNKEGYENGDEYRVAHPKTGKINKKIGQIELSQEQINRIDAIIEEGDYEGEFSELLDMPSWIENNKDFDADAKRISLTGGIHNLQNIWKFYENMGYTIAYDKDAPAGTPSFLKQQQSRFEDLLDHLGIGWQSAYKSVPGVMPGYVNISNPLDTSKPFPKDLLSALKEASKGERQRDQSYISRTHWTKDYPLKEWVKDIEEWLDTGEETYWATQVPTKAKKILREFGYDGIKDTGGKGGGKGRTVLIWFEPWQFKSKFNRGTWDKKSPNILHQVEVNESSQPNSKGIVDTKGTIISNRNVGRRINISHPSARDISQFGSTSYDPVNFQQWKDLVSNVDPRLRYEAINFSVPPSAKTAGFPIGQLSKGCGRAPAILSLVQSGYLSGSEDRLLQACYGDMCYANMMGQDGLNPFTTILKKSRSELKSNNSSESVSAFIKAADMIGYKLKAKDIEKPAKGETKQLTGLKQHFKTISLADKIKMVDYLDSKGLAASWIPQEAKTPIVPSAEQVEKFWNGAKGESAAELIRKNKMDFVRFNQTGDFLLDVLDGAAYETLKQMDKKGLLDNKKAIFITDGWYADVPPNMLRGIFRDFGDKIILHVSGPMMFSEWETDLRLQGHQKLWEIGKEVGFTPMTRLVTDLSQQLGPDFNNPSAINKTLGYLDRMNIPPFTVLETPFHIDVLGIKGVTDMSPQNVLSVGKRISDQIQASEEQGATLAPTIIEHNKIYGHTAKGTRLTYKHLKEIGINTDTLDSLKSKGYFATVLGEERPFPLACCTTGACKTCYTKCGVRADKIEKKMKKASSKEDQYKVLYQRLDGYDPLSSANIVDELMQDRILKDGGVFQPDTARKPRGKVQITDNSYIVSLFKNKNASTLVHEMGHIFLEELRKVSELPGSSEQLRNDVEVLNNWNRDNASDIASEAVTIAREQGYEGNISEADVISSINGSYSGEAGGFITAAKHEQFARGFEAYLREGKTPTTDLAPVFQRFKTWLTKVYQDALSLNVELTDDVRDVFGRMFTNKQETLIAAQENEMSMWTKEQMRALGVVKGDEVFMKSLLKKALEKAEEAKLRAMNQGRRELMQTWRDMAEYLMDINPAYRTAKFLREGVGVDLDEIRQSFGDEVADLMRRKRLAKKGGLSLDEAMVMSGYENSQNMIKDLTNVQSRSDFTKAYIAQESSLHDAQFKAEDYLNSTEEYSQFLELKAKYLNRSEGKPTNVSPRQALKQFARQWLDKQIVRDAVRQDRFMAAQLKFSRIESDKIRQGKIGEAAQANEKVRQNYELAKEALKNREEIGKLERLGGRLAERDPAKMLEAYRNAIYDVLIRFSLAKPKKGRIEGPVKLDTLLEGDDGTDPFFASETLLYETDKSYKDLTMSEAKELRSLLKYLSVHSRTPEEQVTRKGDKVLDVADKMASESVGLNKKKIHEDGTLKRKLTDISRGIYGYFNSLNFVMTRMGGYQSIVKGGKFSFTELETSQALVEAGNVSQAKLAEYYGKVWPSYLQMLRSIKAMKKEKGEKITQNVPDTPSILKQNGQSGWWRPEQIFALAMNIGNESNRTRIFDGFQGMTETDLNRLMDFLTVEDMDAIQAIWDLNDEIFKEVNEVHYRVNGYKQDKIQPGSFTFKGKKYRGGYAPIRYDSKLAENAGSATESNIAALHEKEDLMSRQESRFQVPRTKSGFTQTRLKKTPYPLLLSLEPIGDHIVDTVHYIAYAEVVRDVNRLFKTDVFRDAVRDHLGIEVYKDLNESLRYIANPVKVSQDPQMDGVLGKARKMTTAWTLAYNLNVAAKQFFSSPAAALRLGKREWVATYARTMFNVPDIKNKYEFMMNNSRYMSARTNSFNQEFKSQFKLLSTKEKSLLFGDNLVSWEDVVAVGFLPIKIIDMATVLPLWTAEYNQRMKESGGGTIELHEEAVEYADDLIRSTQPSAQAIDLTKAQRSTGVFQLLSMFGTFTIGKYQQRVRLNWGAMRSGEMSKPKYIEHVFLEQLLPAVGISVVTQLMHGKDLGDDDTQEDIISSIIQTLVTMPIPIVGSLLYPFSSYMFSLSPVENIVTAVQSPLKSAAKSLVEGDEYEAARQAFWTMATLISIWKQVPVSKVVQKIDKSLED